MSVRSRRLRRLSDNLLRWAIERRHGRSERGDVPGWVLITVMSAGVVVAIGAVARQELTGLFTNAVNSVK